METLFIIVNKSEAAKSTGFGTSSEEICFVYRPALNGTKAIIPKEAFDYALADTPEWPVWKPNEATLPDILYWK